MPSDERYHRDPLALSYAAHDREATEDAAHRSEDRIENHTDLVDLILRKGHRNHRLSLNDCDDCQTIMP